MIFIWSSEGGPLQYVGIALFLIQFLPPLLGLRLDVSLPPVDLKWVAYRLLLVSVFTGSFFAFRARRQGTTWAQARGAASDWARDVYERAVGSVRDVASAFGVEFNGRIKFLLLATVFTLSVQALAFGGPTVMLLTLLHLLPVGIFVMTMQGAGGAVNNGEEGQDRRRPASNDLSDIIDIVSKMPIEEYVADGDLDKCSISQLKQMLKIRRQHGERRTGGTEDGNTMSTPSKEIILERTDLVEAVKRCRKSNDSCCICCEEYQTGDPLRVLPKCQHEFHLECIDQWSYTFATSRDRRSRDPSCPLCKTALS